MTALRLVPETDATAFAHEPDAAVVAEAARKQAIYAAHRKYYRSQNPNRTVTDIEGEAG